MPTQVFSTLGARYGSNKASDEMGKHDLCSVEGPMQTMFSNNMLFLRLLN